MKKTNCLRRIGIVLLCFITAFSLVSCLEEMDVGNHNELVSEFLNCILENDYDSAYDMVKVTVSDLSFRNYWESIQTAVEDAESYETQQIGWNIDASNGITTRTTAHKVYFDSGKVALFRVITRDDIEGIAGLHFSDITEFVTRTDKIVPTANIILTVLSVLSFALVVWMLVDCLRRKMKPVYKVLWAVVILVGVSFTITSGENMGLKFMLGLMISRNSMAADPAIQSVMTKVVVPLGAVLYLCQRNKLVAKSPETANENGETVSGETSYTADDAAISDSNTSALQESADSETSDSTDA